MIDLEELERELRAMKPRTRLYEVVKAEMKRQGHWKGLPRGWQVAGQKQCRVRDCTKTTMESYCQEHEKDNRGKEPE